jgi:hypothetical protein
VSGLLKKGLKDVETLCHKIGLSQVCTDVDKEPSAIEAKGWLLRESSLILAQLKERALGVTQGKLV